MDILMINPCLRHGSKTKILPVGIGSVATFLRHNGFEFDLLDIDINNYEDEVVEDFIKKNHYDVVLSGSIVTHYKWMKWMTHTIKKYHPDTTVIVGNSVAGSTPEVWLRNSGCDIAVYGEGEYTALEVLQRLEKGESYADVQSICYLDADGKFIKTPKRKACKIDDLPMLNWDIFDVDRYLQFTEQLAEGVVFDDDHKPRVMPVPTARGCAFKCTFCHYVFWDDPYRHRSADNVVKEIRYCIEHYGASYINFWDDLSFSALGQAEKFVDAVLESGLQFEWSAAVRADLFGNPKHSREQRLRVAKKFKESGCRNVGFSLESGSQEILNLMNKRITPEYFVEQVEMMKEVDISVGTSVVFGYPIETPKTIQDTFDLCLRVGLYPSIGFLMPLPYTGMYTYAMQNGLITDEDAYLDSITERQDVTLNITQMENDEIMDCIKEGAVRLNRALELGLSEETLIRTGGFRNHTKKTAKGNKPPIDPDNMERNENDMSFNYSQVMWKELREEDPAGTNLVQISRATSLEEKEKSVFSNQC